MTCVKDTKPRPPDEVMKALNASLSVLILRQMHVSLPPGVSGDAITLVGKEQHRRWKADEALLTQAEIDIIHKRFKGEEIPGEAKAFVEVAAEKVKRWDKGLPPLSIDEERKIIIDYADEPAR